MYIDISNLVTAFDDVTVGTKVTDRPNFMAELQKATSIFPFDASGQGLIDLPSAIPFVSCGVARRIKVLPENFHLCSYRNEVVLFADRIAAETADSLSCVVYTMDAYLKDPDATAEEVKTLSGTHVLVAILATSGGARPVLSSHRFVRNLAGGNNHCKPENGYTTSKCVKEAKIVADYELNWVTVADRHFDSITATKQHLKTSLSQGFVRAIAKGGWGDEEKQIKAFILEAQDIVEREKNEIFAKKD